MGRNITESCKLSYCSRKIISVLTLKNFIICTESIKSVEKGIISLENIYIVLTILKSLENEEWKEENVIHLHRAYIFKESRNELMMIAAGKETKKKPARKRMKINFSSVFLPFFHSPRPLMLSTVYSECVIFYLNFTICIQNSSIHSFDIKRKLTALG
jgi:hypothetical protein